MNNSEKTGIYAQHRDMHREDSIHLINYYQTAKKYLSFFKRPSYFPFLLKRKGIMTFQIDCQQQRRSGPTNIATLKDYPIKNSSGWPV